MIDVLLQILLEIWEILKEASVFLLFGFLLAGVLAVFVPKGLFTRLLGTGKVKSVLLRGKLAIDNGKCLVEKGYGRFIPRGKVGGFI